MIDKVSGIVIKGKCFPQDTVFQFYSKPTDRISIVYGRNGAGKSTISEGFASISGNIQSGEISAQLIDEEKKVITLKESNKIFVFNENYIDNNIKVDDDSLGTIILLGARVNLQAEIDKYKELKQQALTKYETAREKFEEFDLVENPVSPKYHLERIKRFLQNEWAPVDAQIKGNKSNSKVTENIIEEIGKIKVKETIEQLQGQFNETKELLDRISTTIISYPIPINVINIATDFKQKLFDLLSKKIEKPVLTERETLILETVQVGRQSFVESAQQDFSNNATKFCPYCYQLIDDEYKHSLIESINKVLNKDVDMHKAELQKISFPVVSEDYSKFSNIDAELVDKIVKQQKVCNDLIDKYKSVIQQKINNIYTPISISTLKLEDSIVQLNFLIYQLETKRKEFNNAINKRKTLSAELISINKQIAHCKTIEMYKDYDKQLKQKEQAKNDLKKEEKNYNSMSTHLQELEAQKTNTRLAIHSINNALKYIFFSENRLSLELRNDSYYLKSNGNDVKPKDVSLGERNIIALCYFFTKILSNQEVQKLYNSEEFIIIYDPISSFDFENKVGMISFMRYQINRIIKGNINSKILIMSHDLSTIFDLQKALSEIQQENKANTTYCAYELCNEELIPFTKKYSEYKELLKKTYNYANNETTDNSKLIIGNVMRRVLETFSTFTYQKGIDKVFRDPIILNTLGKYSIYFENLMCRLVLHGESHFEEQVYNLHDDANFYTFVSDKEKQRTAKDILCFIYLVNKYHIQAHLKDISNAIQNIQHWVENIPTNDSFEIENNENLRIIPLYDLPLSAGIGMEILDSNVSFEEYEVNMDKGDFALRISGNSMEPDIPDGSIVLIEKCAAIEDGQVGAFYLNGEVYCKRLSYKEGITFLYSINSNFSPIEIKENDDFYSYGRILKII